MHVDYDALDPGLEQMISDDFATEDLATDKEAILEHSKSRVDIGSFEINPRPDGTVGRVPSPLPSGHDYKEHQETDRLCLQHPPTGQADLSAPVRPLKPSAQGL